MGEFANEHRFDPIVELPQPDDWGELASIYADFCTSVICAMSAAGEHDVDPDENSQ
jgi:hypothetical protein